MKETEQLLKAKDILSFEYRTLREEWEDKESGKKTTHVARRLQIDLDPKKLVIVVIMMLLLMSNQIIMPILPRLAEAVIGMLGLVVTKAVTIHFVIFSY